MSGESPAPAPTDTGSAPVRALTAIGSVALLVAMATDSLAVVGRHLRVPLLGSIEIVQAGIVLAASAATIGTTLAGGHMVVTLLLERLGPARRAALRRIADALSTLFFGLLAAGSAWLAFELWNAHEFSETVGIPIRWLRVVWCASVVVTGLLFLRDALRPRAEAR